LAADQATLENFRAEASTTNTRLGDLLARIDKMEASVSRKSEQAPQISAQ
jgi:hypothetical protein